LMHDWHNTTASQMHGCDFSHAANVSNRCPSSNLSGKLDRKLSIKGMVLFIFSALRYEQKSPFSLFLLQPAAHTAHINNNAMYTKTFAFIFHFVFNFLQRKEKNMEYYYTKPTINCIKPAL